MQSMIKDNGSRAHLEDIDAATLEALSNMDCIEYYHYCESKNVALNYYEDVLAYIAQGRR